MFYKELKYDFSKESLENRIDFSIWFLRHLDNNNIPYHVAFSGGKDSVLLWWLCNEAKVNYRLFFYDNPLLNGEAKSFTLKFFPETKILKPQLNFYQLVELKKMLPIRSSRFCCDYFKECHGSINHFTLTGVRNDESFSRKKTKIVEFRRNPVTKKIKHIINPLIFFKENEVWFLLKKYNLPICDSYKILKRNGCIGCPMTVHRTKEIFFLYPKFKKIWLKAATIVFNIAVNQNNQNFDSPEDLLLWYCSDMSIERFKSIKYQLSFNFLYELENNL